MDRIEKTWLWKLKLRLQFTGWLQFMPPFVVTMLLLLVAGVSALFGEATLALTTIVLALAIVFAAIVIFEVVTMKFGLRPRESIPRPRAELDAFELMRARRACRSFQARSLTDEHREGLIALAAHYAEPERLLGGAPIRFEYVKAPLTVWPVLGASEFFVAIAPKEYSRSSVIDVGRSLQKVVTEATRQGIATCWIGPGADQKSIVADMGDRFDASRDHVVCVCAIGYESALKPLLIRAMQRGQHKRLPLDELFFADATRTSGIDPSAVGFDRFERNFEACQWSPSSFNAQPTRAIAAMNGADEVAGFDFIAVTASRYYAPVALGIWVANWELGCEALGIDGTSTFVGHEDRVEPGQPDVSWRVA